MTTEGDSGTHTENSDAASKSWHPGVPLDIKLSHKASSSTISATSTTGEIPRLAARNAGHRLHDHERGTTNPLIFVQVLGMEMPRQCCDLPLHREASNLTLSTWFQCDAQQDIRVLLQQRPLCLEKRFRRNTNFDQLLHSVTSVDQWGKCCLYFEHAMHFI